MSDVKDDGRDESGKFLPGTSGNPKGRPPGRRAQLDALKQDLEIAVRKAMPVERIVKVLTKMVDLAENGDVRAGKLVLGLAVSSAGVSQDAKEAPPGIHITIENATFAAKQVAADTTKAIDVTVIEEKEEDNGSE